MSVNGVSNVGGLTVSQVTGGMDLEAFMMMVSSQRANNLESQMANQIDEVKKRQANIADLNQLLADVRALKNGTDGDKKVSVPDAVKSRVLAAGCSNPGGTVKNIDVDKWVEELKGKLDGLNSTSQMDMIRLQSISNKRNEAFEQLTNFIQKMSKSRDSIIGNMR